MSRKHGIGLQDCTVLNGTREYAFSLRAASGHTARGIREEGERMRMRLEGQLRAWCQSTSDSRTAEQSSEACLCL